MSIAERATQTPWEGPLASGEGTLSNGSSGALDDLRLTWASGLSTQAEKPVQRSWRGQRIHRASRWRWH